jgi:hypothetical protein
MNSPSPISIINEWHAEKVERICFRGDDRAPSDLYHKDFSGGKTSLAESGFKVKLGEEVAPSYRRGNTATIGDAEHGVCVSKLFQTAVRFPLLRKPISWIYAVWVPRAFNTHKRQVQDGMKLMEPGFVRKLSRYVGLGKKGPSEDRAKEALWALFGEELIVDEVPVDNVIAGVKCNRMNYQDIKNWDVPINYALLGPLWVNPNCTVENSIRQAAMDFMSNELSHHNMGRSTTRASGFAQSVMK